MIGYKIVRRENDKLYSCSGNPFIVTMNKRVEYEKDLWVGPRRAYSNTYLFAFKSDENAERFVSSEFSYCEDRLGVELWKCEMKDVIEDIPKHRILGFRCNEFWEEMNKNIIDPNTGKRFYSEKLQCLQVMPEGTIFVKQIKLLELIKEFS